MIGTEVERRGIIRHGAKMITAVSEATVPKISVVLRKAYGAGLYAMAGPAYGTDCVLALPSAEIAVMGPEPAVNAVFFNQLQELTPEERERRRHQLEDEYREDVDLIKLASNLIVDDIVEPDRLRDDLIARFRAYRTGWEAPFDRRHGGRRCEDASRPGHAARARGWRPACRRGVGHRSAGDGVPHLGRVRWTAPGGGSRTRGRRRSGCRGGCGSWRPATGRRT